MMLGEQIRIRRRLANLKQEHVAEQLGLDQSSYSRIEGNETDPRWSQVKCIARTIGCTVADLDKDDEDEVKEAKGT